MRMRILHHHDDDKEFYSCEAVTYDAGMLIALLLIARLTR
jgi:hypothetical protein